MKYMTFLHIYYVKGGSIRGAGGFVGLQVLKVKKGGANKLEDLFL